MYKFILSFGCACVAIAATAYTNKISVEDLTQYPLTPVTLATVSVLEPVELVEPVVDPKQKECLAKNIYFEAATESTAGKLAVAQVTLNRVKSDTYPNTICEVIKEGPHYKSHRTGKMVPIRDRCQFSWYCDGKADNPHPGKYWNVSKDLAEYVLVKGSDLVDITDGATHYYADYIPEPAWAREEKKTTQIDFHIFYKLKNIDI